jgi:sulfoquinovose isomerase
MVPVSPIRDHKMNAVNAPSRPNALTFGANGTDGFWLDEPEHHQWLWDNAQHQFDFFRASLNPNGGFYVLDYDGAPLPSSVQELHTTTRLIHSFALGKMAKFTDCDAIIDHGMEYVWAQHRDTQHGGYIWALDGTRIFDGRKLAYGHVFVLLAGASARLAGHPDADRLIDDASDVLDTHFWEDDFGRFREEWNRDWTPFSTYRGMNANMHGVEALLTAFEATGREIFLDRAGNILDFFVGQIAPNFDWRFPEHYKADWQIDPNYSENPMFRPAGTTPGHSFELARLALQYWDLRGRPSASDIPTTARNIAERAFADAWDTDRGGLVYTLNFDGTPAIKSRYWWPVTEAIGTYAALIKLEKNPADEVKYRQLWQFAADHFIDHAKGGWFPEIDDAGKAAQTQFAGKPDIYHSLQATLLPTVPNLSRIAENFAK